MYYNYDIITSVQNLYQWIEIQQKKIEQLEMTVEDLQKSLETLKQQNTSKIERIEYKFDQLKVERLEGTLNIGITPNGGIEPSSIEEFTVNRNTVDVPASSPAQQNPLLFENIRRTVYDYLNKDCYDVMTSLEKQYNYHLDGPYRNFIVEDIRKQIDSRIHYYLKGVNVANNDDGQLKEIQERTITKVKSDINKTIEQFIKHMPQKGE